MHPRPLPLETGTAENQVGVGLGEAGFRGCEGFLGAWEEKRVLKEELRKRLEGSEGKSGVPKGAMKVLRGLGGGEGSSGRDRGS